MNKNKILHIFPNQKFTQPFIDFINTNFPPYEHLFLVIGAKDFVKIEANNIIFLSHISLRQNLFLFLKLLYNAKKIIFHSLFFLKRTLQIVLFQPWLLKKSYWIMWGGDFYFPEKQPIVRKKIIKKVGYCVCGNFGDYELAKKLYSIKGKRIDCFMYPSNLFVEGKKISRKDNSINILVGNSGSPSNNHIEVFNELEKYKNSNINVFCPLSYGDEEYTKNVIKAGHKILGKKFKPITEFLPYKEYIDFLSNIDIALFNHDRQQAVGNITTLLGFGKKVYLKDTITTWKWYNKMGIKVYDISKIEKTLLSESMQKVNKSIIKSHFSKEKLYSQLAVLFKENR